jgi:hypothetical protein
VLLESYLCRQRLRSAPGRAGWLYLASCSWLYQDQGFQGFYLPDVTIVQPKTPPGGDLTPPENATNRRIASISIRSDHAIAGVKRDRIVQETIRLLKDGLRAAVMEPWCGLQTFRLQYRPWHYAS